MKPRLLLIIITLLLLGMAQFAKAGSIGFYGNEQEPMDSGGLVFRIVDSGPFPGALISLETNIDSMVRQHETVTNGWAAKLALDYDLALVTPEIFASYLSEADLAFQPTDAGLWVVGLKAKKLSLFPRLTHDIALMYGRGMEQRIENNALAEPDRTGLTSKDSLLGISWDTRYQLLEQLAAYMELGYIRIDRDEEPTKKELTADQAYRMSLGFKYDF